MNKKIIVSDVGGTNGRFAIANFDATSQQPKLSNIQVLPCHDFNSFSEMLSAYADTLAENLPDNAHFSIAGEIYEKHGYLWHHDWHIYADELTEKYKFKSIKLMNDYIALANAIPFLSEEDTKSVTKHHQEMENMPITVFGIGSGLGASILYPGKSATIRKTIATEPGHMAFAPKTKMEIELFLYLSKTLSRISIETLLSGPGIKRIFSFFNDREKVKSPNLSPSEITERALKKDDIICMNTIDLFISIVGGVAGDLALAQGAKGGIYIGGGIIPKIADLIPNDEFLNNFYNKGPMQGYVADIPVKIITASMPGLLGAAISQ